MEIKPEITFADFQGVDIRIGTVMDAYLNEKARNPAYVLRIDFGGEIGEKTSSAQLTQNYQPVDIIGQQVCAVMNFPAMRVAGIKSEVLVLAAVCEQNGTVLLHPSQPIDDGTHLA